MILDPKIIVTGIGIGILITAPVGPVNILVIQRALGRGYWGGLVTGLGATIGDGFIATAAAFGIKVISSAIVSHKFEVQLIGGILLLAIGLKLLWSGPRIESSQLEGEKRSGNLAIISQTFLLTITNPGPVLGLFAIVGGVGSSIGGLKSYDSAILLVVGIMVGSVIWWLCLSRVIVSLRHRLDDASIRRLNRLSGYILCGFGLVIMVKIALEIF